MSHVRPPDPIPPSALRRLAGFLLRLGLIYGVLVVPWLGIERAYARVYRASANLVFGNFGSGGAVRFQASSGTAVSMDSEVTIGRRGAPAVGTTPHDSRLTGYLPTAEVVALILATPLPWRRRAVALAWGLLLVHAFIALRLEVMLLHWFSGEQPWCLYRPGPFWDAVLKHAFEVLVVAPTLTHVVPVFIWIVATFRRGDRGLILPAARKRPKRGQI